MRDLCCSITSKNNPDTLLAGPPFVILVELGALDQQDGLELLRHGKPKPYILFRLVIEFRKFLSRPLARTVAIQGNLI
jgi:hypothetical protein